MLKPAAIENEETLYEGEHITITTLRIIQTLERGRQGSMRTILLKNVTGYEIVKMKDRQKNNLYLLFMLIAFVNLVMAPESLKPLFTSLSFAFAGFVYFKNREKISKLIIHTSGLDVIVFAALPSDEAEILSYKIACVITGNKHNSYSETPQTDSVHLSDQNQPLQGNDTRKVLQWTLLVIAVLVGAIYWLDKTYIYRPATKGIVSEIKEQRQESTLSRSTLRDVTRKEETIVHPNNNTSTVKDISSILNLKIEGQKNLLNETVIKGVIYNNSERPYKDVIICVYYYKKDDEFIGQRYYTVSEFFPPRTAVSFKIKERDRYFAKSRRFNAVLQSASEVKTQQVNITTEKRKLQYLYHSNSGLIGYFSDGTVSGCPRCDLSSENMSYLLSAKPHSSYRAH